MGFHSRKSSEISQYLSEWDEALWQYREVATTRMTPIPMRPASTPTPLREGGSCDVCGAVIGEAVGSRDKHDEWHDTMTQAIKEQVEEQVKEALKEQAEARDALLSPTTPNPPSMPIAPGNVNVSDKLRNLLDPDWKGQ